MASPPDRRVHDNDERGNAIQTPIQCPELIRLWMQRQQSSIRMLRSGSSSISIRMTFIVPPNFLLTAFKNRPEPANSSRMKGSPESSSDNGGRPRRLLDLGRLTPPCTVVPGYAVQGSPHMPRHLSRTPAGTRQYRPRPRPSRNSWPLNRCVDKNMWYSEMLMMLVADDEHWSSR